MDRDLPADPEGQEDAFWQTISERLSGTLVMLEKAAAEWNIVLEEPDEAEAMAYRRHEALIERELDENSLLLACAAWADAVDALFLESSIWKEKGAALARETALGLKTLERGLEEIELVEDCFRVLNWYQHFIGIKFRRALHGALSDPEEVHYSQSDVNGSAKIALLAVERSRLALTSLLQLLSDEDQVLPLLAQLERIGKLGRERFPVAESFRRPGFDDE
jgi:hypothetical protein